MKTKMRIGTLKDLKDVLIKIPDEDLSEFGIGCNIESDFEIDILTTDEDKIDLFDKYKKQIHPIRKYIKNICEFAVKVDSQEDYNLEDLDDFIATDTDTKKFRKVG